MNALAQQYPEDVRRILAKYPVDQKRSAVMPLLYLAQRQSSYITRQAILDIAELAEISATEVMSVVGFYSLYHEREEGHYRVQVCTDLSCALRGADPFLQKLCQNLGIKVGGTTPDGMITIEEVTCLAGCDKGPMFQLQGDGKLLYYENQTEESAMQVIDGLRQQGKEGHA
jgi:NADH-quinone oxidoreductase subunit E